VVDGKVPVEIKKDFKSTAAYHRTIGQLNQYLEAWQSVILVLCGDVSSDLFKDLRRYAASKDTLLVKRVHLYRV